ncbi:proline-serine-threonine phosphatase-interacting protein 2-like isoform X2 [Sphaeramia orbicularis]|uniref:proline-serine-threonine phosphatase-interacting protein 2-like isoform X2 n=1 Tax=Sphaeramia orbicularis TaxID=375764 RepID=UPI0011811BF9|nr:proline-serine-threonine phosphatase-interacting protein 2-like isoform X2 [Sphaeramia orbicularis]
MKNLHFKDYFWNTDLTSTAGYDAIIQYHSDCRRTCKEVEEFMKASTLKRSLDMFKLQTEHVSLAHLQLAQNMRDEAKKLEEFREKQREARKKVEQQMDALHKQKALQFKKTMDSKKTYEQKCRDKEEADQNVNRNTNNTKHMDKLYAKAQQAKQNAEEADKLYQQNVSAMGKIKDEWQKEHVKACEIFEKQAMERINFLRNTVWTHVNQLSQQCVTSDELYEEVRKSLEQTDVQEDIEHFVNLRRTGDKPPAPVLYENFYSSQRSPTAAAPSRLFPPIVRRGPLPDPTQNTGDNTIYSTVQDAGYSVIHY